MARAGCRPSRVRRSPRKAARSTPATSTNGDSRATASIRSGSRPRHGTSSFKKVQKRGPLVALFTTDVVRRTLRACFRRWNHRDAGDRRRRDPDEGCGRTKGSDRRNRDRARARLGGAALRAGAGAPRPLAAQGHRRRQGEPRLRARQGRSRRLGRARPRRLCRVCRGRARRGRAPCDRAWMPASHYRQCGRTPRRRRSRVGASDAHRHPPLALVHGADRIVSREARASRRS